MIKPIGDRILIKTEVGNHEELSKSGILLHVEDVKKRSQGKIIALGNGPTIKELGLKEGDMVVLGKYTGEEIEIDKEEFRILNVSEVLAIID